MCVFENQKKYSSFAMMVERWRIRLLSFDTLNNFAPLCVGVQTLVSLVPAPPTPPISPSFSPFFF